MPRGYRVLSRTPSCAMWSSRVFAAIAVTAIVILPGHYTQSGIRGMSGSETQEFDVVVVGCGVAGLSAAVAAQECGRPRGGAGTCADGRARRQHALHDRGDPHGRARTEIAPDFEDMFAANSGYHLDPVMVAETAADYANWPGVVKTMPFADPELVSTFAAGRAADHRMAQGAGRPLRSHRLLRSDAERSSPRISISRRRDSP